MAGFTIFRGCDDRDPDATIAIAVGSNDVISAVTTR
jgi:hypothetical protein